MSRLVRWPGGPLSQMLKKERKGEGAQRLLAREGGFYWDKLFTGAGRHYIDNGAGLPY